MNLASEEANLVAKVRLHKKQYNTNEGYNDIIARDNTYIAAV